MLLLFLELIDVDTHRCQLQTRDLIIDFSRYIIHLRH
jgi:hypothetical protein